MDLAERSWVFYSYSGWCHLESFPQGIQSLQPSFLQNSYHTDPLEQLNGNISPETGSRFRDRMFYQQPAEWCLHGDRVSDQPGCQCCGQRKQLRYSNRECDRDEPGHSKTGILSGG